MSKAPMTATTITHTCDGDVAVLNLESLWQDLVFGYGDRVPRRWRIIRRFIAFLFIQGARGVL